MGAPLKQIAGSMRRVRFGEAGFQGSDHKTVWHQASEGCEMVTRVNREGKVIDHEFTLRGEDIAVWHREKPLRTGRVRGRGHSDEERLGGPMASLVDFDAETRWAVVEDAAILAELVPGNDRYLLHAARALRDSIAGARTAGGEPVTTVSGMKRPAQVTAAIKVARGKGGFMGLVNRILGK